MKTLITILVSILISTGFALGADSDIDKIKKRVLAEMLDRPVDDNSIEELVNTLNEDGTWPGINYADVSREGFEHRYHYSNMVELARAYKTKSSAYYKKKEVKRSVELALQNWVEHDYFCDNWWYNQSRIV